MFRWFNRRMEQTKDRYAAWVHWSIPRYGRLMLIYAGIVLTVGFAFVRLPGGFLPVDDQGFITTDVLTPPEASFPRTLDVVKRVENYLIKRTGVDTVTFLTGFSFLGQGQNTAQAFVALKDWSERGEADSAERIVADINRTFAPLREGKISAVQPPPIDNLGNTSGFSFRLQDRGQRGYADLMRARDQLLAAAARSPILQDVYVEGLAPAPQIELVIDREKAAALGVTFEEINNAISTSLGSAYINDFPNRGRMQRVIVQADRNARMQPDQILTYNVRNSSGQLVPMSSFATVQWSVGPSQIVGFNYYPSVRFSGSAKPGYTSGDAIREMERLAARLPRGFGFEWAGQSLQEKLAGSQAPLLLMLSVLLVFLVLAALYESWTIPLSVLLTVPLGILGAVTAAMLRGLPNDVYFTVGIVTIIGLAAKDGILIIEFAKALRQQGLPIKEATIAACRMRFRPIVMTGLAFVFGVAPMIVASGASAKSQQELGTVVMGGMTAVVILALAMVPVFFVSVQAAFNPQTRRELRAAGTDMRPGAQTADVAGG
jgi:multidrug efflux pump